MQELCNKKAVFPFREAFSDTLPASAAELALQTHLGSIIFIENSQSPTEYDFVHYLCMSTQLSNLAHAHIRTHTYTHVLAMILWNLVWFSPMSHRWQTQAGGAWGAKSFPKFGEGHLTDLGCMVYRFGSWSHEGCKGHSMYFSFLRSAHQW